MSTNPKYRETEYLSRKQEQYIRDAELRGLTFVGLPTGDVSADLRYRLYKCNCCGCTQNLRNDKIRMEGFKCPSCEWMRLEKIAAQREWVILTQFEDYRGKSKTPIMCLNLKTGKVIRFQEKLPEIKRAASLLKEAFENQYQRDAAERGFTILGPAKEHHTHPTKYRHYRMPCGHCKGIDVVQIRRDSYWCLECAEDQYNAEATAQGLVLLGPAAAHKTGDTHYKSYRFPCGHITDLQIAKVRIGGVECKQCIEDSYHKEARDAGLTLLGKCAPHRKMYRRYAHNCCDTEHVIQIGAVRARRFTCPTCDSSKCALHGDLERVLPLLGCTVTPEPQIRGVYRKVLNRSVNADFWVRHPAFKWDVVVEVDGEQHFGASHVGTQDAIRLQRERDARLDVMFPFFNPGTSFVRVHQGTPVGVAVDRILAAGGADLPVCNSLIESLNVGDGRLGRYSPTFFTEYTTAIQQARKDYTPDMIAYMQDRRTSVA